jgi:hypothetical protein
VKQFFGQDKGFTIAEVTIGALFAMVVIGALYGFYREQLFGLLAQEAKTVTLEEARGALDLMVREIRNAGGWSAGTVAAGCTRLVEATSTRIHLQADLDGNGDCSSMTGEDVVFGLAGSTATCQGVTIRRNGDCLVGGVAIPPGEDFLSYYAAGGGAPLGHPITDFSGVQRVKVAFAVQVQNPNPRIGGVIQSVLSSSVELRN